MVTVWDVGADGYEVASEEGDWEDWLALVRQPEARVVVQEGGAPVAALVPLSDYRRLRRMETARRQLRDSIDEMQRAFAGVPLDEIEREVARAVVDVRNEDAPDDPSLPS